MGVEKDFFFCKKCGVHFEFENRWRKISCDCREVPYLTDCKPHEMMKKQCKPR